MKKKRNWTKTILFLAVLSVSILGISYAGWNDSLFMGTAISIGEIELSVISLEPIESLEENEKFTWPGGNADYFTATVNALAGKPEDPAFGLNLSVRNSGSLPVIIEGVTVDPGATGENIAVTAWRDNDGVYRLSLPYSTIYGNWQKTLNITGSVIINEIPAETTTRDAINLDIAENTFSENPKDYLDKNEGNNTAANTTTNTVSSEIADTIANEAAEADEQEPRQNPDPDVKNQADSGNDAENGGSNETVGDSVQDEEEKSSENEENAGDAGNINDGQNKSQ